MKMRIENCRFNLLNYRRGLKNPLNKIEILEEKIKNYDNVFENLIKHKLVSTKLLIDNYRSQFRESDPQTTLERGYAIVYSKDKPIKTIKKITYRLLMFVCRQFLQ